MPQFHETGYGQAFFNRQLPELIKNMGRIADALEKSNEVAEEKATYKDETHS